MRSGGGGCCWSLRGSDVRQHLRSSVGSPWDPRKEEDQHFGEHHLQVPLHPEERKCRRNFGAMWTAGGPYPGSPKWDPWPEGDWSAAQDVHGAGSPTGVSGDKSVNFAQGI